MFKNQIIGLIELQKKKKAQKIFDILYQIMPKWDDIKCFFEDQNSEIFHKSLYESPYKILISAINQYPRSEVMGALNQDSIAFEKAIDISHLKFALYCFAIKNNDPLALKLLTDAKLNINIKDDLGITPLHYACKSGTPEMVEAIINGGGDIHAIALIDGKNLKPINFAIDNVNPQVMRILVDKGEDINHKSHTSGLTPLHRAASLEILMMKFCLERGANVNVQDNEGKTPLHYVSEKTTDKINFLIEAGADIHISDNQGKTPLHYASGKEEHYNLVTFIKAGAKIAAKDYNGMTPLHCAVRHGVLKNTQLLIESGADVNVMDINGLTPLHYAIKLSCKDIINTLIESGAQINIEDIAGMTPLHYAAQFNNNDNAHILLNAGADITLKNNKNMTPLDLAISKKNYKIVKLLSVAPSFDLA